jgi:hypothetical protein
MIARLVTALLGIGLALPASGQQTTGDTQSAKAVYYTQGVDDSPGDANNGTVIWSRIEHAGGLPAIQAKIEFTEPKFDVVVTLSYNSDSTFPASHLIEITFNGLSSTSETGIESIPALVLKLNEQARGRPLTGAGVSVAESIFWIALSDNEGGVSNNMATLREGRWFDMPILFEDQTRALITFEKGHLGEQVFDDVLAAWPEAPVAVVEPSAIPPILLSPSVVIDTPRAEDAGRATEHANPSGQLQKIDILADMKALLTDCQTAPRAACRAQQDSWIKAVTSAMANDYYSLQKIMICLDTGCGQAIRRDADMVCAWAIFRAKQSAKDAEYRLFRKIDRDFQNDSCDPQEISQAALNYGEKLYRSRYVEVFPRFPNTTRF